MTVALSNLTSEQRAAVVLVSLDPAQAQPLAELLGVPAMRRIRSALSDMPHISDAEVLGAFAEFITQLNAWRSGLRGGEAEAIKLMTQALGEALVEKIRGPVLVVEAPSDTWDAFAELEPDVIADYVGRQHSTVAALMLNRLPADRVPEVLGQMSQDSAVESIAQMSLPRDPSPAAAAVAERMIRTELLGTVVDASSDPRIAMIGETLGTLPRELRDSALKRLEEVDEARAAAIRSSLLQIEDLPKRLPTKSVQAVFRETERDILIKGLRAIGEVAPEVSDFLLGNIAQRMADQFREDIDALPAMDDATRDRAVGGLVREILGLSRRGLITLNSMPDNEA